MFLIAEHQGTKIKEKLLPITTSTTSFYSVQTKLSSLQEKKLVQQQLLNV